jgi:FMN-dependent NADH-azoreductase
MPKLLNVVSSPRGERSASVTVANAFIEAYRAHHADTHVDTLNVWHEAIPEFNGHALEAKYAGLAGVALTDDQQRAWERIRALAKRFHDADVILLGVPMWNFGIPYKLKHLIDFISQKDVMFRFDASGFEGMLKNKRAVVICARGISYATGTGTPEAEYDFQKSYLLLWLRFVGVTDTATITVEQTLMDPNAEPRGREQAKALAQSLARQ